MTAEEELKELKEHINKMFDQADAEGLYIGLGYKHGLSRSEQEGPMVKKLRKLVQ